MSHPVIVCNEQKNAFSRSHPSKVNFLAGHVPRKVARIPRAEVSANA